MVYIVDGSLESILSAVFEWFERKPGVVQVKSRNHYQPDAFTEVFEVFNDPIKASRVWEGLQQKLGKSWTRRFYCTFLSELPDAPENLFEFACYIFSNPRGAEANFGNEHVLNITKTATKVEREKHRMEAFIRFQHTSDGIFYCGIDPDFNVLPLIMNHFKNRYADQKWIIYDIKRNYGLYYDLEKVEEIKLETQSAKQRMKPDLEMQSEQEGLYAALWVDYFKSTNIVARKNTKLHIRHVPKRYWKYLTEKQLD
jgi:probable DNA metabolism protein